MSSLKDELNNLLNPKPKDFNPDDVDGFENYAQKQSLQNNQNTFDNEISDDFTLTRIPGKTLSSGIELSSGIYEGKKISRKELEDSDDSLEFEEQNILDNIDSDSSIESIDDSEYSSEFENQNENQNENQLKNSNQKINQNFTQQLKQIQQQEQKTLEEMKIDNQKEMEKANAAFNQRKLWNHSLNLRILLQKILKISNEFPDPKLLAIILDDQAIQNQAQNSQKFILKILSDLIQFKFNLTKQNNSILKQEFQKEIEGNFEELIELCRKFEKKEEEISSEKIWGKFSQILNKMEPIENGILDKWNRKTQIATGHLLSKKFKSLNQSVLTQIDNILKDKERLVKRTQLKRANYEIIGEEMIKKKKTQKNAKESFRKQNEDQYNEQIFDDLDFYQKILKNFIQNSSNQEGFDSVNAVIQSRKNKPKKAVDRKSSKGRQIRYVVHEKLVNFMTPTNAQENEISKNLLNSLFQ